jgi:hypothetical protein
MPKEIKPKIKPLTHVRITIEYRSPMAEKISSLMSGMDLGIDGILPPPIEISFTTKTTVTKAYVNKLQKQLTAKYEEEGGKVISYKTEVFKNLM